MANECSNYITIKGDPILIQLFADSYLITVNKEEKIYNLDFNHISPIPENCDNEYDYVIKNWGNKWDGTDAYVDFCDDEIFISVATAWSPCDKITYKLIELCPGLNIYHEYYEEGVGFIGWINHEEDQGPYDYEEIIYSADDDRFNYFVTLFEKDYEDFDWLSDVIEEKLEDKEITQKELDELMDLMKDNNIELLISECLDKGVL